MIGELKLIELRDKAKQAFGDRFDIRQYHDVVLGAGSVPLEQLESIVDVYLRRSAPVR
jgi:uncharacterized protein (DUF885 family)